MNILGKATDKSFWERVRTKDAYEFFRNETMKLWNEHCEGKPIYALKYSDFKLFFATGDRKIYENTYFTRRLALDCSAVLSLIYPEEEKYFERLMDTIYAICDEYTWCLPAHQKQNEYNDNAKIDLFAAETGFALAEIYTILGDRLDSLIKSRIESEIERRIFATYESEERSPDWWESSTSNWNAVCSGSVACTYMLIAPERAKDLLPRFEKAMGIYLSGFCDDGVCDEGCVYWKYGFGFFIVYADMLSRFTDGEIDHFESAKVKKIAQFEQNMFLTGSAAVSFADSSMNMKYHLAISHYLKQKYPEDNHVYDIKNAFVNDHCGRFCLYLRAATWFCEEYFEKPDLALTTDFYASDAQWLVKKTHAYAFAAKGGNNGEKHNHNDVGCFIFSKNGEQVIADPGSGLYTRQYFDPETRYTIFEATSKAHSVPIINGQTQKFGKEYAAKNVRFDGDKFSLDISDAYGIKELRSISRSFCFEPDAVTLNDRFDYDGECEIVERFICTRAPELLDGEAVIGDTRISGIDTSCCKVTVQPIKDGARSMYLLDVALKPSTTEFNCKIK